MGTLLDLAHQFECLAVDIGVLWEDVVGVEEEDAGELMHNKGNAEHPRDDGVEAVVEHDRFGGEVPEDYEAGEVEGAECGNGEEVEQWDGITVEHGEECGVEDHGIEGLEIELVVH
jgi:hypothetical protein